MRELMSRNALTAEAMVSCIFTLTDDLDAEFPASGRAPAGTGPSAAAVCPRGAGAGLAAPRDQDAGPLLRGGRSPAPPRVSGRGAGPEARPRIGTIGVAMAIEFGERIRRIPSYPLAAGYDLGADTAMLASNESCFAARARRDRGGRARGDRGAPIPGPLLHGAALGPVGALRRSQAADRAGQRLLRHPAVRRRGAARARGRDRLRLAGVQRLSAPGRGLRARAPSRFRSTTRIATTSTRWRPRSRRPRGWC